MTAINFIGMNATISKQIKEALSEAHKTQEKLGERLGLSLRTIQQKLQHNNWRVSEIENISEWLGTTFYFRTSNNRVQTAKLRNMLAEDQNEYEAKPHQKSAIHINVNIDPPGDLQNEDLPEFFQRLNAFIKEYKKDKPTP